VMQPLVSFLECEMKAGEGGTGFTRKIIVRSTFWKHRARIGEVVDEEVSITVLPPRGTVANGESRCFSQNPGIDVSAVASTSATV